MNAQRWLGLQLTQGQEVSPHGHPHAKLVAGLVVAYAIGPIDLIPDFVPALGYVDDVIIVPAGIWLALRLIPPAVMQTARQKAEQATDRPVLAAALIAAGVGSQLGNAPLAGCWIGALFAIALQTSFLTPPFGYALFLVHGATRGEVPIAEVWRGAMPYVALQLLALLAVALLPELAAWLPAQVLDLSIPKGPKFSDL